KKLKVDPNKVVGKTIAVTLEDDEYEGKEKSTIAAIFSANELQPVKVEAEDEDDEEEEEETQEEEPKKKAPAKKSRKKKEPEPEEEEDDEIDLDDLEDLDD